MPMTDETGKRIAMKIAKTKTKSLERIKVRKIRMMTRTKVAADPGKYSSYLSDAHAEYCTLFSAA
jgi:hypothetical protein